LYYVVVEDPNRNVKTPSQSNIRNSKDASGTSANGSTIYANYFDVSANAPRSYEITGLKGGTNYKVFGCVYESATNTNSLYSRVKSATFTTTGTNVSWITTFEVPQNSISATSATLNVRTDRAGTLYYVVTTDSRTPTANNIVNGLGYNNSTVTYSNRVSVSANTTSSQPLSNLTTGTTTYYVFGVLYTNTNEYSEIKNCNFAAGNGATQLWSVSYTVSPGSVTPTSGAISFSASGNTYTANSSITVNATDATNGAVIRIAVTKGSGVNGYTVTSNIGTGKDSASSTEFAIPVNTLYVGSTNVVLTVQESNRNNLTYTITINRQS
jgi:hypothetical protein